MTVLPSGGRALGRKDGHRVSLVQVGERNGGGLIQQTLEVESASGA